MRERLRGWSRPVQDKAVTSPSSHFSPGKPHISSSSPSPTAPEPDSRRQRSCSRAPSPSETSPAHSRYPSQNTSGSCSSVGAPVKWNAPELIRRFLFCCSEGGETGGKLLDWGTAIEESPCEVIS